LAGCCNQSTVAASVARIEQSDIRGLTLRALQALAIAWRGIKTKGPMAPEIPMEN